MRRVLLLAAAALVAGCGSAPRDPGSPQALRVLALAAHERTILDRAAAAVRTRERLVLQELLAEARLGQEDIEATVPFGAPARAPALDGAREVVRAIELRSPAHAAAGARAFAGAAGALEPSLTPVQADALARLRAPAPSLR